MAFIGAAAGYAGQLVGEIFGCYSKLVLGLVLVLFGASLGNSALRATRIMPVVRVAAGIPMLGVGFFFLATI